MTVLVKKSSLTVPRAVTKKAGIKPCDLVAFTVHHGTITIQPATQLDESRFPTYTPTKAEKRAIVRGRAAYKRGDFPPRDQLHKELEVARHAARKRITRKAS